MKAATILHDTNSVARKAENLNYSIANQPATAHDLLLRKNDGTFVLVVWNEQVKSSASFSVEFGATLHKIAIYDPTEGTSAVKTLQDASAVPLTLSNHPVVIEIKANARKR
jgi:hypothetical protein